MAFSKKAQTGTIPRYSDPAEMQEKIDAYFEECEGEMVTDHNGDPVFNRFGEPVYIGKKAPTTSGLARALGFKTRNSLLNYQAKPKFQDTILEAKLRIEIFNEEQLYTRDGQKGAMFNLSRNFAGWQDKIEDLKPVITIINDIPKGPAEAVNTSDTAEFNPLQKPDTEETEETEEPKNG